MAYELCFSRVLRLVFIGFWMSLLRGFLGAVLTVVEGWFGAKLGGFRVADSCAFVEGFGLVGASCKLCG